MKKLGIVITDGVGFRNFIMSDFVEKVSQEFDTVIIYSGLPKSAYDSISRSNIIIKELDVFVEGYATWFFRKWKEVAHLQRGRAFYGMKDNKKMNYPGNNSPRALLIKLIYFVTYFYSSNRLILFAEKMQFLSFSRHKVTLSYLKLLQEDSPTHLFFTHQRPSFLAPFLYAAIQLKIPTSSFIFSWDNLASKGRMLGTFDGFLVWSHLMKEELLTFYPNVASKNIKVVGTPQFEPYVMSKYGTIPQDFYAKFNLDPHKKIICFSCADASLGKNDALVIETIAQAIRDRGVTIPCQLLVRTSPAEEATRFATTKEAFPEIIWNNPKWISIRDNHAEAWSQRIPTQDDITDLRAILEYTHLSINMCSTMSLDFMLFDKPVINTVFGNLENGLYDDQKYLKYVHYKRVVESGAVTIAKNATELVQQINQALENPKERSQQRKEMIDLQISQSLEGTSERIARTLSELND
jgi:hypothetical protein